MSFGGFHGLPRELQVNVLECNITPDTDSAMRQTEWYLCVQYGSKIFVINSTYIDGGINPTFQDKIVFELTGLARELIVVVAKNKAFASDDIVGTATIPRDAVLHQGYGEFHCALQKRTNSSRAGELKLRFQLKNNANTNTLGGSKVPLWVPGGYNLQAAASHYYPYNNLAAYPPLFPYPPANPIPYYYIPPPRQQPLLDPRTIVSHGIGGIVNAFVEQLIQNLTSNLSQLWRTRLQ